MQNYSPNDYSAKLKLLKDITGSVNELCRVDFHSLGDMSLDGASDLADAALKEVNKTANSASSDCESLLGEILGDIKNDLDEKIENYVFLVQHKIEEDEFPFSEWYTNLTISQYNLKPTAAKIFDMLEKVAKTNIDLAKDNFARFLFVHRTEFSKEKGFYSNLKKFVEKTFPDVEMENLLLGVLCSDFNSALNGKKLDLKDGSTLFYEYAASIPNEFWPFQKRTFAGGYKKHELIVISSTSDYDLVFPAFMETKCWKMIAEKPQYKEIFINELMNRNRIENQFFTMKQSSFATNTTYFPHQMKWDVATAFVKHVLKEEVKLTEHFVAKILDIFTDKKMEDEVNLNTSNLIKLSLYMQLGKDVKEIDIPNKRHKL